MAAPATLADVGVDRYIVDFVPARRDPPSVRAVGSGDDVDIEADGLPAVTADGKTIAVLVTEAYLPMDHDGGGVDAVGTYDRLLLLVDVATGKPRKKLALLRDKPGGRPPVRAKARARAAKSIADANARLAELSWLELAQGDLVLARVGDTVRGRAGALTLVQEREFSIAGQWSSMPEEGLEAGFVLYADFAHCQAFAMVELDAGSSVSWQLDTFALPRDSRVDDISAKSCP